MPVIPVSCTVNENQTIGLATLPAQMRVSLTRLSFNFHRQSEDYLFIFSPIPPFTFNWADGPIDWGEPGRPSWLSIVPAPPDILHLRNDSRTPGIASFTIRNASGPAVPITIENAGGEVGDGGDVECGLKDKEAGLITALPAGVSVAGSDVAFGLLPPAADFAFEFTPTGSVAFNMPAELPGLTWGPPASISVVEVASDLIAFTAPNPGSAKWSAVFTLYTNFGGIDPTIVGDPDVGGPLR